MDSASLDFISMLIRGRNPNILFFGTVLPFCSNMNKILKPLCEENLLSHLEISPPAPVESGTAVKAMKADYFCQLSGPAESLSHTGTSVLELLSACQSTASFGLFEDLLRENPLNILDTLEQLKNLGIIEERFEQQSPYFVFCNNSTRRMIYERMSPSRRCYYHRILAEHLKHMEALGAVSYTHLDVYKRQLLFPVRQRVKHFHKLLMQQSKRGRIQGHLHMVILDKISEVAVLFLPNRSLKRNRILRDFHYLPDALHRHIHPLRHFLRMRLAPQLLEKLPGGADQAVNRLKMCIRDSFTLPKCCCRSGVK